MIMNVYSIRDVKAGYLAPSLDINDQTAARGFKYAFSKPDTLQFSNVQDYDLFRIGTFDNETGVMCPCDKELIFEGASLLRKDE